MKERIYFPELDGLRMLAFLAVFIHHGPFIWWIPGYDFWQDLGWIGVDLFLCLSAFLFVRLLKLEWEKTGRINIKHFYIRRTLRIWPVYFLFTIIVVVLTSQTVGYTNTLLLRAFGLWTFTDNLLTFLLDYSTLPWTAHLWTISYEEQFYVLIPWFLRLLFSLKKQKQIFVLSILFLFGIGIRSLFIAAEIPHPSIWVLPFTHFESILFGIAIGLGIFDTVFKRLPAWITCLGGITGLYFCTFFPNINIINWSLLALYPLAALSVALLIFSTLRHDHGIATGWLRWKPVVILGKISYGQYLFHLFALQISSSLVSNYVNKISADIQPLLTFGIGLAITISIAFTSYILVEKPFLQLKPRFTTIPSRPN